MIKSKSEKVFDVCNVIFMVVLTCLFVIPILIVVAASFTSAGMLTKHGYSLIVRGWNFSAYSFMFKYMPGFFRSIGNSLLMTALSTFFMVITTSLYAYAVTRKQLQFRKFFTIVLVIPMLFAGGTVPYYTIINSLGLDGTRWAIILPFSVNAWYILLVKNFLVSLPESLIESAQIEGANNFQVLFKIVIPLIFPIIATIILYTAVAVWNDWFQTTLFLISNPQLWPVQFVVKQLSLDFEFTAGQMNAKYIPDPSVQGPIISAAVVTATLPIVIVYPFLQRYFIDGTLVGGVKE